MPYTTGSKTLVHVVQNLSLARSVDEVMKLVRTAAREIAQADGATFVLRDNSFCYYADEDSISPLWKGQRFPINSCISGWAMLHRQAVMIEDIYKDSRIPIDAYRPTFVKSLAMTPIRLNNPIGAIGTYWKDVHRPSPEQMEMLQALADTTSVALENVSLYKSLEERIEELRKVNHAKNEFLMTLSHELRTPLNSIVGWSEILSAPHVDEAMRDRGLRTIHKNAVLQAQLIDDLLDVSQMVSGKFEMNHRREDLALIVNRAIDALQMEIQSKKLSVDFASKVSNAFVIGDAVRIQQVIRNILKNAIDFSSEGGRIQILLSRAGPHLKVEVVDHGQGISAEFLPELFDVFRQGDSSTTRKHQGLGLGLYIARFIAEAHHGHISVFSSGLNQGSTFRILLPAMNS